MSTSSDSIGTRPSVLDLGHAEMNSSNHLQTVTVSFPPAILLNNVIFSDCSLCLNSVVDGKHEILIGYFFGALLALSPNDLARQRGGIMNK